MESAPQAPAAPTEPAHNQLRPLRESSQPWKLLGHGELLVPIAASWSLAGGQAGEAPFHGQVLLFPAGAEGRTARCALEGGVALTCSSTSTEHPPELLSCSPAAGGSLTRSFRQMDVKKPLRAPLCAHTIPEPAQLQGWGEKEENSTPSRKTEQQEQQIHYSKQQDHQNFGCSATSEDLGHGP